MTAAVAEVVEHYFAADSKLLEAQHAVLAALGHFQGEKVDVESYFSAVQMLSNVSALEVSPFVAAWEKPVAGLVDEGVFLRLERALFRTLQDVIYEKESDASYLSPMLKVGRRPINIVTLNYDRTVENLARHLGLSCVDGVNSWNGGLSWRWPQRADVRLLKLHGSVNWWLSSPSWPKDYPDDLARRMKVRRVLDPERHPIDEQPGRADPAMIFGRRGKLRSEGPYLAMIGELREYFEKRQTTWWLSATHFVTPTSMIPFASGSTMPRCRELQS